MPLTFAKIDGKHLFGMPEWTRDYFKSLEERFHLIVENSADRVPDIVQGRVAPGTEDLAIGSAKQIRAAVLFFDIRGFSQRTGSAALSELRKTLHMLNCVVPIAMHIIFDQGGYVEKNTGDGIMAIFPRSSSDREAADAALDAASMIFYVLRTVVNPYLTSIGIDSVDARIGIDLGTILVAKIGTHTGNSRFDRNFSTAIGPAANIACKIQHLAGTNQIFVGDLIRRNCSVAQGNLFLDATPHPSEWDWSYANSPTNRYFVWHFAAVLNPPSLTR